MKKLLLGTLALIGISVEAEANMLTIYNNTPCTYTLSISGAGGATVLPGMSTIMSVGTANIDAVKIMYVNGTNYTQVNVGYGYTISNSIGQPTPPCLTASTYFTAAWSQASVTANATLSIF